MTETMPQPPGIRRACMEDETLCRRYGAVVTAYDPDTLVGGIYSLSSREWALFYPIDKVTFAERAAKAAGLANSQKAPAPVSIN